MKSVVPGSRSCRRTNWPPKQVRAAAKPPRSSLTYLLDGWLFFGPRAC